MLAASLAECAANRDGACGLGGCANRLRLRARVLSRPRSVCYTAHSLCASAAPGGLATWRSGYVADCKSAHPGSIPGVASKPSSAHQPRFSAFYRTVSIPQHRSNAFLGRCRRSSGDVGCFA